MKGFLITVGLILASVIVLVTQSTNICQYFYTQILTTEGGVDGPGRDAFDAMKANDPDQFKIKYTDAFQNRLSLSNVAFFMASEEFFRTFAEDTRVRYIGTPFDGNDDFAKLLERNAKEYDNHSQGAEAYTRMQEIVDNFPNYTGMADVDEEMKLMRVRYNLGMLPSPRQWAWMGKALPRTVLAVAAVAMLCRGTLLADDQSGEVSLDQSGPSPTFTVTPTFTPSPTTPPTETPVPVVATPVEEKTPADGGGDLSHPNFDSSTSAEGVSLMAKDTNENDGLILIAPGSQSPEDSLEAFGIDTPFNWKEEKRLGMLSQPSDQAEASIELNPPDTSDLKNQVAVEQPGKPSTEADDYDAVERAGFILSEDEFHFDGYITGPESGRIMYTVGDLVYLKMDPGTQIYPGSIYTSFHDEGKVIVDPDGQDLGHLVEAVGVLRIVRVDSMEVVARVEKLYTNGNVGDGVRLRDPDRAKHFADLRQASGELPPADVSGKIVALQDDSVNLQIGNHVYLNLGSKQGVQPGMNLVVYRNAPDTTDPEEVLPGPTGKIGELLVISTHENTSTALLVKAVTGLRVEDLVRYR